MLISGRLGVVLVKCSLQSWKSLSTEVGDAVKIAKVNVDENPESASRFGVMSIPTLIFFKDGQPVDKVVGLNSKDALKGIIAKHQ